MDPFISDVAKSFARDLDTLSREVALYPDDASVFAEREGLPNTGGNLVLHLCGNVRHFIGLTLGHSGYVRNRDHEFAARETSRADLEALISAARTEVAAALAALPASQLAEPFPIAVGGVTLPTRTFLLHLATHFTFHLGQIDYHRRIVTGNGQSAGTLPITAMV